MKQLIYALLVGSITACAAAPRAPEIPLAPIEDQRATETLMTDPKFQEGLDAAMASGTTLEPYVQKLATVPATDESRVLMTALLEEEIKRRPIEAPPLVAPITAGTPAIVPTPLAESRTPTDSSFWNENRIVGALIGIAVLGTVMATTNYKLVITTP